MKRIILVIMVLVGGMVLTNMAVADDAEDVKAAVLALDAAYENKDMSVIVQYMHPERSSYRSGGGLLAEGFNKDGLKAAFDAGLKIDTGNIRHVTVKTYGNTGVVTGYQGLNVTLANGTIIRGTVRVSEVWTKQQGKWKLVHSHSSPLEPAPRERISPRQESTNGR